MKKMKTIKLLVFLIMLFQMDTINADSKKIKYCETSKEFIITMEFLKDNNKVFDNKVKVIDLAKNVASGCDGAAKRFIETYLMMSKVGFPTHKAVKYGVKLSHLSNDHKDTFQTLFKMGYLKKYLDFDLFHSLKMTDNLMLAHNGNIKIAKKDFSNFVQFCVGTKHMDLPRKQCANFSTKMALMSAKYKKEIFSEFKELFEFLTQNNMGPKLTTNKAFQEAQSILSESPIAGSNFMAVYKYSQSKNGLKLGVNEAIKTAKSMSFASRKIASEPK